MKYQDVFILTGTRLPTGKFNGSLSTIPATQLGAHAIRAAIERADIDPKQVDEVLMGNVVSAGLMQAPARQAAIGAGLPDTINATLVNKVCGSSLKTLMIGTAMIRAGDANIIVSGGFESMSRGPYLNDKQRSGARMGDVIMRDAVVFDALTDPFHKWHMGNSAEFIAQKMEVTREEQDEYALRSHQRAIAAQQAGKFRDEITPIKVSLPKSEPKLFDADETIRADTSLDALSKLKPAFQADGTVTAGNAPGWSDGAAAVVIAGEDAINGHQPLARVVGYHQAGLPPEKIFWTPINAINGLVQKLNWKLDDVDLFELNEAFAAQVLADGRELGWDWNKVNVNGGAIALGHPLGATGAKILVTLLYELKRRGAKRGIASACLGGGEAVAVAIETV
ncbi:MAG TPA: acetyl-CoA C-acetyltransferase [Anaerolineae bacterium]|nr:acetyl-CoA C-acetyltransferase [Anaerolineae bacterium]